MATSTSADINMSIHVESNENSIAVLKEQIENNGCQKVTCENKKNRKKKSGILNDLIDTKIFPIRKKIKMEESITLKSLSSSASLSPNYWFSPEDCSNRIDLAEDGKIVKYSGPGRTDSDAAAVRANFPIPPQIGIYYYETKIVSKGREGYISVGFAIKSASLGRLAGWEPGTVGYHADDGNIYRGAGTGTAFGPAYSTGDVVGCGINYVEKSFFFTKNGVLVGEITNLKDKFHLPFFPCVGCRTVGEILSVNFGFDPVKPAQNSAFMFDINGHIEKKLKSNNFSDSKSKSFSTESEEELIMKYLIHSGYERSALAFLNSASTTKVQQQHDRDTLIKSFQGAKSRRLVFEAIKGGQVRNLIELLAEFFPGFLMESPQISFKLECFAFIETVRGIEKQHNDHHSGSASGSASNWENIIQNGQRLMQHFPPEIIESNTKLLKDTLALVAYSKPSDSPIAYLLQKPFRIDLATAVDAALLKYEGNFTVSPLHRLVQQCQVVMDELQYMEDPEVSLINL